MQLIAFVGAEIQKEGGFVVNLVNVIPWDSLPCHQF